MQLLNVPAVFESNVIFHQSLIKLLICLLAHLTKLDILENITRNQLWCDFGCSDSKHFLFLLQVSECGWSPKKAPTLASLFAVCKNMHLWLRQNPKNVCVVHCMVSKISILITPIFYSEFNNSWKLGVRLMHS